MKNKFLIVLLLCSLRTFHVASQNFRDPFLGRYTGTLIQHTPPGGFYSFSDTYFVTISLTDTNMILVNDSLIGWNYEYVLHIDSNFENIWLPAAEKGHFYDIDSIYVYEVLSGPYYQYFYGKRTSPFTGINENDASAIFIFPNPAKEKINLMSNRIYENATIELINSIGQSVFRKRINIAQGKNTIDLSEIDDGIYFIRILEKKILYSNKLIIQK